MSTESGEVRAQHTAADPHRVVAVTGVARGAGRALVERLAVRARSETGLRVVAIDARQVPLTPGAGDHVAWRAADVRSPSLAGRLGDVDTLVHLDDDRTLERPAPERRRYNVRGVQTVLTAAAASRVRRVVLVTSTMVHGAHPDNPVPLPETAPVPAESGPSLAGDFVEIEELADVARRAHPGLRVSVVRPAPLVGPDMDTLLTRHFAASRLLTVRGSAQHWQFCHEEDLASALEHVIRTGVDGPQGALAVGCAGTLDHPQVEGITQRRSFELPANLIFGTNQRLHRMGVTPVPAADLRFLVYPCVVDCQTLRANGWEPAFDNEAALRELLPAHGETAPAGRELGSRDGTTATITAAGAAGAAAAVMGTAAAVRHLRKRRRDS
ncbi:NAD-dependent epimerase/dehydratase family protein [Lipingzhangella sp. LS1_29]|uniref:NAD-dependent epimerase/dehydratase family protein n=1 Tax=Lipingzhangella rawalii TaxID=2055835 RepID=A0ABU2HB48_9ACTN|nr:NAD-dependent epimerase/dehydratase family protein [Lipingzhangella rawalii]MDS1272549.1 NAD-dependent epimerase/dehydratase family protein [Lipingzhangella rawalii]